MWKANEAVDARYVDLLGQLGIQVRLTAGLTDEGWADALLVRGKSEEVYTVFVKAVITAADAARFAREHVPTLVLTHFVSPRTADTFRRMGLQYLDSVGNAWLKFGDVLVDIRGRPRPSGGAPAPATGNLFSTARAQVSFALLAWPQLWEAPRRDLARAADVSVGQAHNTLLLLAEAGYGQGSQHAGQPDLLDLWTAAFPTGLANKLSRATYNGTIGPVKPADKDEVLFVSGASATADQLRPATLTLYTGEFNPRLAIVNRWRSDGPVNIEVRHAFWRAPDGTKPGVHIAPWPLVYADLAASDDPRVKDAARTWRKVHDGSDRSL